MDYAAIQAYRASSCRERDGVVLASCVLAAAHICHFAQVDNASGFGRRYDILVCKAEQETLLEYKPAPSPGAQVFPLRLQPARLLGFVPVFNLILSGQLQK